MPVESAATPVSPATAAMVATADRPRRAPLRSELSLPAPGLGAMPVTAAPSPVSAVTAAMVVREFG